ncbi:cobalamin-dependent protein [Hwanghaeella sp.]|uniref:cobalamin-dependent protein n=1 Tax=Hwanghaeella sp. TaxID=2605943 RepID=UPI003CCB90DF
MKHPSRSDLVPDSLTPSADLLARGRALAENTPFRPSRFMREADIASEAAYKAAAAGRIMQHAHIGFRNLDRTLDAMREVHDKCAELGVTVDRFGITLDWSMGYPEAMRADAPRGTGIVLTGPGDFRRITEAVPAATHFGDFMLGLPGALENTRAAIEAGATALGNLGQYFTFRLPGWDDDVATTEATVTALGLIAAQDTEILVHSNLDDGFAGLFLDMCCSLGMVLVEKHIVETLIGARLSHCYGHHFSDPLSRMAFHAALTRVTDTPGTMIFGNTVSYQSTEAGNYASLANYLLADIVAQRRWPSGHAINPVPVTENVRIPDVEEIIDAQTFAHRLAAHAPAYEKLIDWAQVEAMADRMVEGGRIFAANLMNGLQEIGVDTADPAQMMLVIRRFGPKRLEAAFGPGQGEAAECAPLILAEWARELDEKAADWVEDHAADAAHIARRGLKACIGTSDVHEHGKYLVEKALTGLGVEIVDGGVSVDPDVLVDRALAGKADLIAVSTYNGVARSYTEQVLKTAKARGAALPVIVGGRLNEIRKDSNSDLPVDVTRELVDMGAVPCNGLDDVIDVLKTLTETGV